MSGYDRNYGPSSSRQPLGEPSSSRLPAEYGSQQRPTHPNPNPTLGNNPSMSSVAAWREQQASLAQSGNLEDDDRLDDNASSEGLGAKRSHDSLGDRSDEPRRKRLVTTPHQVNVLSEELRRNPFPNSERRDELARELGMEPRRVQVWFQNRRQAERLARGRPPYNMMYATPFYPPPPYGYPPYPGMPPSGSYPPTGMSGDPSLDILIPYGPRRPSLMPPSLQGDSLMRGGLPPSHAMSGSLASRQSANDIAAASYRPGGSGQLGDLGRRDSSGSTMRTDDFGGQPSTLSQDLAAVHTNLPSSSDRHGERRQRGVGLGQSSGSMSSSLSSYPSHMQPFQSSPSQFTLPPPSTFNRLPGLPSLNSSLEDPFHLPLPQSRMSLSSSRSAGLGSSQSSMAGPFDSNQTLAPPRSGLNRGMTGSGRLPSLSQALEMHPELSPDPTSFRYPPDFTLPPLGSSFGGTLASTFGSSLGGSSLGRSPLGDSSLGGSSLGGGLGVSSFGEPLGGGDATGSGRGPGPSLRRRNSISRMNNTSSLGGPALSGSSSSNLHMDTLPPLAPLGSNAGGGRSLSSFNRPLDSGRPPPGTGEFAHPSMTSNPPRLRRMPSDATIQASTRRQSLRDSEMSRAAAFPPPSGRYH